MRFLRKSNIQILNFFMGCVGAGGGGGGGQ